MLQQARDFTEFCRSSLSMVYNAMFPRNQQPKTLAELKKLFRRTKDVHHFVKAQLVAGAKLALGWVRYHNKKIDFELVARGFSKRKRSHLSRHYDVVAGPAK